MLRPVNQLLSVALLAFGLGAPIAQGAYTVERVVSGLNQPIAIAQAPGDNNHLYIVERTDGSSLGRVLRYNQLTKTSSTFLDLTGTVISDGGLLSMTFHPEHEANGLFYTVTNADRVNGLDEWRVVGGTPVLQRRLYEYENLDNVFHTLNQAHFRPGGDNNELFVLGGDGGTQANSPGFNPPLIEDPDSPYGKMLKFDLTADYSTPAGGAAHAGVELVAAGLRNPYRSGFDRVTGDFYIGDVGFNAVEEVDFIPSSYFTDANAGPLNFGWTDREGTIETVANNAGGPGGPGDLNPIFEYAHNGGVPLDHPSALQGASITGGYVYRGPATELEGRYFFADFVSNVIYSGAFDPSTDPAAYDGDQLTDIRRHDIEFENLVGDGAAFRYITSFGEDNLGNLYIVKFGDSFFPPAGEGEIFRVSAAAPTQVQVVVDRDTGQITLQNISEQAIAIDTISLSSAFGAVSDTAVIPITGNHDVDGDQTIDDNDAWAITSQTNSLFSEMTTGDSGALAALSQLQLTGAGGWLRSPEEDIAVTLLLGDGSIVEAAVAFTGNGGEPFELGDLDFDGRLDRDDFVLLAQGAHTDLGGLSPATAYGAGDLNGDDANDYLDFVIFKNAYIAAHGEAAFNTMTAAPEPGVLAMLLVGAALPLASGRRFLSQTPRLSARWPTTAAATTGVPVRRHVTQQERKLE